MFELNGSNNFNRIWNDVYNFAGISFTAINKLLTGKFDGGNTKILVEYGSYASTVSFDLNANNWVKQYTNPNAGNFAGWTIPFNYNATLLSSDIDKNDGNDEMIFIASSTWSPTNWAATIDLNNARQAQWHWGNNGSGYFGFWGLQGNNQFDVIRTNPNYKAQIIAFNRRSNNYGFTGYSVGTLRASNYNFTNYKKERTFLKMNNDENNIIRTDTEQNVRVNYQINNKVLKLNFENISYPYSINFLTIDGKIISKGLCTTQTEEIDFENYASGIYLINIISNNFNKTLKIKL